ncbi:MAG: low temperature requirement protein A [Solirubrobacterales bacterium]|nr:low temperature requirement protein A [Solirubrobacterales bacterium]
MAGAEAAVAPGEEQRASPLELFFDLVFVFAITQVTALVADDLTWAGFGRGMLVLALLWWAWSAYVWVVNAQDPDATHVRLLVFASMVLTFLVALTVPHAFGGDSATFAWCYAGVRLIHLVLYADASRRGRASWGAIAGFAVTTVVGMALLVVGAEVEGDARLVLWTVALALDVAGPWLTRRRLRGLQTVGVTHFAERFALFVIICLGESIVALGVGAQDVPIDRYVALGVATGIGISAALWWTYFDYVAGASEERLAEADDAVSLARDAYSYAHVVLVAGIIVLAVGLKKAIGHEADPLADAPRLALCGGVALYLAGHLAFRLRMIGTPSAEKAAAAVAVLLLYLVTGDVDAWVTSALVLAVLALLVARENVVERSLRDRLHHRTVA